MGLETGPDEGGPGLEETGPAVVALAVAAASLEDPTTTQGQRKRFKPINALLLIPAGTGRLSV